VVVNPEPVSVFDDGDVYALQASIESYGVVDISFI